MDIDRLLAVALDQGGERVAGGPELVAARALRALASRDPLYFHARVWKARLLDRAMLRRLETAFRDPELHDNSLEYSGHAGLELGYFFYPTDPALRREFVRFLLNELVHGPARPNRADDREALRGLLQAMAYDDDYQADLKFFADSATDPKGAPDLDVRAEARNYLFLYYLS